MVLAVGDVCESVFCKPCGIESVVNYLDLLSDSHIFANRNIYYKLFKPCYYEKFVLFFACIVDADFMYNTILSGIYSEIGKFNAERKHLSL